MCQYVLHTILEALETQKKLRRESVDTLPEDWEYLRDSHTQISHSETSSTSRNRHPKTEIQNGLVKLQGNRNPLGELFDLAASF